MIRISYFILFILFIGFESFGQSDVINKITKESSLKINQNGTNSSVLDVNSDFNDVVDLSGVTRGLNINGKPSDVLSIKELSKDNILNSNVTSNIFSHTSDERALPLGLSIRNISSIVDLDKSPVEIARSILSNPDIKAKMKIENDKNFRVVSFETDDLGISHVKMNQYFNNLLIFGGQIYVHIYNENGMPTSFINGRWFEDKLFQDNSKQGIQNRNVESKQFNLKLVHVKRIVENKLAEERIKVKELKGWEKILITEDQWSIEKIYFQPEGMNYLVPAYIVDVIADPMHRYKFILDGSRGNILRQQHEHCNFLDEKSLCPPDGGVVAQAKDLNNITRSINVFEKSGHYYMIDASKAMYNASSSIMPDEPEGVIWTIDANNSNPNNSDFNNKLSHVNSANNTWDKTPVSAHFNAGYSFDYYKDNFGRNSINGNGGNVVSIVNVTDEDGNQMDNAFWGGTAMFYGNGDQAFTSPLAKSLDVSGHELTHGVIQSTANLEYYDEPGAINESFADVFGAMMDRDNWQMGEDVVNPNYFPSGALRDLSDPHNGASQGSNGWQPAHTNEKYNGEEDNRGVHINSGIVNYAFYKFASAVGKEKAEQVYYRALTSYLTKSSRFVDLRVAIEQSANDLYGDDIKNAASNAFTAVGIGESGGGDPPNQTDLSLNPGNDYIICTDENYSGLYLFDGNLDLIGNPLSSTPIQSKPSISDNGTEIVFVGQDEKIHYININWQTGDVNEDIIQSQAIWRNAIISKDGEHLAALTTEIENKLHVYNFNLEQWKEFELKNPTSADGIELGSVLFADAMEFDYSGEWIMLDSKNSIGSSNGFDIEYWDIGFVRVWDNALNSFSDGRTQKLFSELPEDVSIGNPSFSKNSPYIIAFDYIQGSNYSVLGANVETGDVGSIFNNYDLGYPSYSRDDKKVIFDYNDGSQSIAIVDVDNTKINQVENTGSYFISEAKWGVWFSNGTRNLQVEVEDIPDEIANQTLIYPNPVSNVLNIESKDFDSEVSITIFDLLGNKVISEVKDFANKTMQINISSLSIGNYYIRATDGEKIFSSKLVVAK